MTLRGIRKESGLSSAFVSRKLGILQRQLQRIEQGVAKINREKIKMLANIYGVEITVITEVVKHGGGISRNPKKHTGKNKKRKSKIVEY